MRAESRNEPYDADPQVRIEGIKAVLADVQEAIEEGDPAMIEGCAYALVVRAKAHKHLASLEARYSPEGALTTHQARKGA